MRAVTCCVALESGATIADRVNVCSVGAQVRHHLFWYRQMCERAAMTEPETFAGGFRRHGKYGGETLEARAAAVMREYRKTPGVLHPAVVFEQGTTAQAALAAEHAYLRGVTDQLVRGATARMHVHGTVPPSHAMRTASL